MKSLKCLLVVVFVLLAGKVQGDIIMIQPNDAKISVRISNLSDFPDVTVIGYRDCVSLSNPEKVFKVDSSSSLQGSEKCPLTFYIVDSKYLNKNKLEKIDFKNDKNVQKLNLVVYADICKTYDYTSIEVDYSLARKKGSYYLYNSQTTYLYQKEQVRYPDRNVHQEKIVEKYEDKIVDPFEPLYFKVDPILLVK
jgi:hypothetical protein